MTNKVAHGAGQPRVCYLLKRYPRLSQTFIVNEMSALRRLGLDLVIVASRDSGEEIVHEKCKELDVPIYYMPQPSEDTLNELFVRYQQDLMAIPEKLGLERMKGSYSISEFKTWVQVAMTAPLIASLGIDHIHGHFATWGATAGSIMSTLTGIPFSFTAHARDIYHQSIQTEGLVERIERAHFTITVSDYNKKYLDEMVRSYGRTGKIIRLYNGMDLDQIRPEFGEKEQYLFVSVGRLVKKKGFQFLLEACNYLKELGKSFQCVIVGEGEERSHLEKLLAQYQLEKEVTLAGAKPQGEVLKMIRRATAFVLPCIVTEDGDRDGLPTVILEAMALGTPVISSTISGIPEMISDGVSGLLVPEKNARLLSAAMGKLLRSKVSREKYAAAALSKVRQDFDLSKNAMSLKSHFLTAVEGK